VVQGLFKKHKRLAMFNRSNRTGNPGWGASTITPLPRWMPVWRVPVALKAW